VKISPGKHWGMRRLADGDGFWRMVATDQREFLAGPIAKTLGVDVAPYEAVAGVVTALASELSTEASAVLLDPIYGYLPTVERLDPSKGVLLSYESLQMIREPGGLRMEAIPDWSVEKIRALGADAVKVLVLYRADATADVRCHQEAFVQTAGEACERYDIPMLLEILVYPADGQSPEEFSAAREQLVVEAVEPFRDPRFKADIFKLEPPGPLTGVPARNTEAGEALLAAYRRLTDGLPRPWVLLSAGMSKEDFRSSLVYAYECDASGYLAGRALWSQAPLLFPDIDAVVASLREESLPYMRELNEFTLASATPWYAHSSFSDGVERAYPLDRNFASHYRLG
jgi:tagatose 1,6-diphosphate aldolase